MWGWKLGVFIKGDGGDSGETGDHGGGFEKWRRGKENAAQSVTCYYRLKDTHRHNNGVVWINPHISILIFYTTVVFNKD